MLYKFGSCVFDTGKRQLSRSGQAVPLAPKAFELLLLLVESGGRALSKAELMQSLWPNTFVEEANLSFQISTLRKALGDDGARWIETVSKHGYRFAGELAPPKPEAAVPQRRRIQWVIRAALARMVRKCLTKSADDRWQTARDLVGELRWISESSSQAAVAPAVAVPHRIRFQAGWIAAAVLAAALAALLAMYRRESHPVEHTMRFLIPLPEGAGFRGNYDTAVLSPDGTHVVFTAEDAKGNPTLYVRSLDSLEAKPIPGTSGWRSGYFPFWSPDGRSIGFGADLQLKKVDLLGGDPVTLCPVYGFSGGTWSRDGIILFSSYTGAIQRVSAGGGKPTLVTDNTVYLGGQAWPSFLPDGRHFLFTATAAALGATGIYVGSLDSTDTKQVSTEISNAQYSSAGFLVFGRGGGAVMAQPFDAARLRVTSEPTQIASGAGLVISAQGPAIAFSVAGDTIVYLSGAAAGLTQLTWFDRKGGRQSVTGEAADWSNPAISPDGRTLAVCKRDPVSKMRDIWTFDVARGTPTRLTFDPADDFNPLWSPDGRQIVFVSYRKGHRDLYRKASSGAGGEELLLESDLQKSCDDWTRDGRFVIFNLQLHQGDREIWALPLFGDRKPFRVISGPGRPTEGHVSPDGKWISYTSLESGTEEIYVQDFPPTGSKWQVSFGGGNESSWSPSGKELFYLQGDQFMAVDVNTYSGRFERKAPRMLFEVPFGNPLRNAYLVSPDGQKFLVNTRVETKTTLPMTLVLNWPATLKH